MDNGNNYNSQNRSSASTSRTSLPRYSRPPIVDPQEKYHKLLYAAFKEWTENNFVQANFLYSKALDQTYHLMTKVHEDEKNLLRFLIAIALFKNTDHNTEHTDFEAINRQLQKIDDSYANTFPAIYCFIAKIYFILFRFEEASEYANLGFKVIYKVSDYRNSSHFPGTNVPIEETQVDELVKMLSVINEMGLNAASFQCSYENCLGGDRSNENQQLIEIRCEKGCLLYFHNYCWIQKKKAMSTIRNIPDSEMIGIECFSCAQVLNERFSGVNYKARIITFDFIDEKSSELLSEDPKEHENESFETTKDLFVENIKSYRRPNNKIAIKLIHDLDDIVKVVSQEEPIFDDKNGTAFESQNIYRLFRNYILTNKNKVKIRQILSVWQDVRDEMNDLKNLDIVSFLLNTKKIIKVKISEIAKDFEEEPTELLKDEMHRSGSETTLFDDVYNTFTNACSINDLSKLSIDGQTTSFHNNNNNQTIDDPQKNSEELDNYKKLIIKMEAEITNLTAENKNLWKHNSNLKTENDQIQASLVEVQEKCNSFENDVGTLLQEKEILEKKLAEKTASMTKESMMNKFLDELNLFNEDWEKKLFDTVKDFEKKHQVELNSFRNKTRNYEVKLLNKTRNDQYLLNKNYLQSCIDQCDMALDVALAANEFLKNISESILPCDFKKWRSYKNHLKVELENLEHCFESKKDIIIDFKPDEWESLIIQPIQPIAMDVEDIKDYVKTICHIFIEEQRRNFKKSACQYRNQQNRALSLFPSQISAHSSFVLTEIGFFFT